MAQVQMRQKQKRGGAGIGSAIGKVGGAIAGGLLGGPGGALTGAGVGGQIGGLAGGIVAPGGAAGAGQALAPQTAVARRLAEIDQSELKQLRDAQQALPSLPPDVRQKVEAPIMQAMEMLKGGK